MSQRNRIDRTTLLSTLLTEEARFIWKHRASYRPGLNFVPPPEPTVDPATVASHDESLDLVLALDLVGVPVAVSIDHVVKLIVEARGTARELPLVEAVLWKSAERPIPEALRQTCADVLAARGYLDRALAVLAGSRPDSAPAKDDRPAPIPGMDDADPAVAAASVAAALSRDIDAPGQMERHARARAIGDAARLSIEAFRSLGGRPKRDDLHRAGRNLEVLGETTRAGEAYALAGDQAAKGLVGVPSMEPVGARVPAILVVIGALDRRGRRLEALAAATAWLKRHDDEDVAAAARGVFARLLRGPAVVVTSDGAVDHYLLGPEITIGRAGATIALASPAVSRRHVRLRREGGRPVIEDLGSHNGTRLGGANIIAALPVGDGLTVDIAGQIPCSIRPMNGDVDGPLLVEIAGARYVVPLGEARIGALRLVLEKGGEESIVALHAAEGVWAALGERKIEPPIELCEGDVIRHGDTGGSSFQIASA